MNLYDTFVSKETNPREFLCQWVGDESQLAKTIHLARANGAGNGLRLTDQEIATKLLLEATHRASGN